MKHTNNRINYLSKEFSTTHANSEEVFITNSPIKRSINQNNNKTRMKKTINEVLSCLRNKDVIYTEVEYLCFHNDFKKLCGNCSKEKIIAILGLFVLRTYVPKLKEEENPLWREYNLNWKLYSRVIANVLKLLRENQRI